MKHARAPCSTCLRSTNHEVLFETSAKYEDWEEREYEENFAMLRCAGCEAVSMARTQRYCDDAAVSQQFYPSPTSRTKPSWWLVFGMGEEEEVLNDLLYEIYQAADGGQCRLAVMGIRALLEQTMIAKVGDQGNFKKNLDAFQECGYISTVQHDIMQRLLDLGHGSMHRGYNPTKDELNLALDITEAIIGTIYHHHSESETLTKRLPPRPTPKKT